MQEFTTEFLDDLLRIGQTILRGLALALGQEEDFFVKVRPYQAALGTWASRLALCTATGWLSIDSCSK